MMIGGGIMNKNINHTLIIKENEYINIHTNSRVKKNQKNDNQLFSAKLSWAEMRWNTLINQHFGYSI